jgi:hypothetical protein
MSYGTKKHVRLKLEELEPRSLLASLTGGSPDVTGNGSLSGGGFPVDPAAVAANATIGFPIGNVSFSAGGAINVGDIGSTVVNFGFNGGGFNAVGTTPGSAFSTGLGALFSNGLNSSAPDANTGVGQMTITTGANTAGLGSFATSTLGFASENGGRSGG